MRLLLLSILLGCAAAFPSPGAAAPFLPESDARVLERLPWTPGESRARRAELAQNPQNLDLAIEVARADVTRARVEGDPRYLGHAEAALAPWWDAPEPPLTVLVLRATIRQSAHDFDGALDDLRRVLERDPHDPQAWLTQALIQQARGDYADARRSCAGLLAAARRSAALQLAALTCTSGVASFAGEARRSYTTLSRTLAAAGEVPSAQRVWLLGVLADIATRLGDTKDAQARFEEALLLAPRDSVLRTTYADFLLDQHRPTEALALLGDDTRNDGVLLRIALAESALGAPSLAAHIDDLRGRFAVARLRNDQRHLREEARFTLELLHDPVTALALAENDWAVQREPEDARVLVAAARAAGNDVAVQRVLGWVAERGLQDVRLSRDLHESRAANDPSHGSDGDGV